MKILLIVEKFSSIYVSIVQNVQNQGIGNRGSLRSQGFAMFTEKITISHGEIICLFCESKTNYLQNDSFVIYLFIPSKKECKRTLFYVVGKTLFQYPERDFFSSFAFCALSVTSTLSPFVAVSLLVKNHFSVFSKVTV